MNVLILAEIGSGTVGGGESVVVGFVRGLAALGETGERYTILCAPSLATQLRPLLAPHIQVISRPKVRQTISEFLISAFGGLRRPLGRLYRRISGRKAQGLPQAIPELDNFTKTIPHDVLHFAFPTHFASGAKRCVFGLYDLQHEHLSSDFGSDEIGYRRLIYDGVAREAAAIVSISRFTTADFLVHHPCDPGKIYTVPLAPYVGDEQQGRLNKEDQNRLADLPSEFILYPAFSYKHKNHQGLLAALSLAERESGLRMPLVCTGGRSPEWDKTLAFWRQLNPQPELIDMAYTSRALLQAVFQQSRYVVFPSKFEGQGLPLIEAARCGKAVACSDIPPFREFGGDGPVFFDPYSPASMAGDLIKLWQETALRERTVERTQAVCNHLTLENTARAMRAIYRKVAGATLTAEDQLWLEASK